MTNALEPPRTKDLTDAIARALSAPDGGRTIALMCALGLLEEPIDKDPPSRQEGRVGIWEATGEAGAVRFIRSKRFEPEFNLWADVPEIPPKGARRRVVFIGESAAAGWLYGNKLRPAAVLESLFSAAAVPGGVEVVDLARVGLSAFSLVDLVTASFALQPDAMIIFAGNNMSGAPPAASYRDWTRRAETLRTQGVGGVQRLVREELRANYEGSLSALVPISESLPVAWVLPETNLGEFSFEHVEGCPWLPGDRNVRWWTLRREAEAALAAGDLGRADELAAELLGLDEGTNPAGFLLRARCRLARGETDAARELLEEARDARLWEPFPFYFEKPPGVNRVFLDAMRRLFATSKVTLVDLPRAFAAHLGGRLPGTDLFLDYCHMSAQGIALAMAETVVQFAPRLGGKRDLSSAELVAPYRPDPAVEGRGRLAAAIHGAMVGQTGEALRAQVRRAFSAFPESVELALAILRQTPHAPLWTHPDVAQTEWFDFLRPMLRASLAAEPLSRSLCDALADVLEERGVPARRPLERTRDREFAIRSDGPTPLLTTEISARRGSSWANDGRRYYRAFEPRSEFRFRIPEARPLAARVVARRPFAGSSAPCTVKLNDVPIRELVLTRRWSTATLELPAEHVKAGDNHLTIEWPLDLGPTAEALERAADRLALCTNAALRAGAIVTEGPDASALEGPDIMAVLGEVHSLTVAPVR